MLGVKIQIRKAACPFCGQMVKAEDIEAHKNKLCPKLKNK